MVYFLSHLYFLTTNIFLFKIHLYLKSTYIYISILLFILYVPFDI
jgi:hypothetical protein